MMISKILLLLMVLVSTCPAAQQTQPPQKTDQPWKGMVFCPQGPDFMDGFNKLITEALAPMGINVIIFDMHWKAYHFTSVPQLDQQEYPKNRGMNKAQARQAAAICKKNGIRVLVGMNCVSHQNHGILLQAFPEFKEGKDDRCWCPLHPQVNQIAFKMIDELLDAFQADGFHVGMDEAYNFRSADCPRCKDKDPAQLFAQTVKDLHCHIVGKHKVEMLIWGDMLLGWHGRGTKAATDLIPKDIIICDWQYGLQKDYPSVRYFLDKGFRVWPSGWNNVAATKALIECSQKTANKKMLGHLYTTWCGRIAQDLRPAILQIGDQSKLDKTALFLADVMRETLDKLPPPQNDYEPASNYQLQNIEGWAVHVNQQLLDDQQQKKYQLGKKALRLLEFDLFTINRIVPSGPLAELQKVPIWLEYKNDKHAPCAQYHPSRDWLENNGFNPIKAKSVEISQAKLYLDWTHDQPFMLFHELAHAYHDRVLGFDEERILALYKKAVASKKYESVLRFSGQQEKHYALNDQKEYFCEMSEAYFGTNDFYPFVQAELKTYDPEMYNLLKEIWGPPTRR